MEELVEDDVVPEFTFESGQFVVEIQMAVGRAGCPFITHGMDAQLGDLYFELFCPFPDAGLEIRFSFFGVHGLRSDPPSRAE